MKELDEDNCLTGLAHSWMVLQKGSAPSGYTSLGKHINEMGDKYGLHLKLYNLLGISLMAKGEFNKALKVFEQAIESEGLNGEIPSDSVYKNNHDLASLIYNYFKCQAIVKASWESVQEDESNKKLMTLLLQVSDTAVGLVQQRQRAEEMFNEAMEAVQ